MSKTVFINLPVADVARATAFYQAIGFTKNEQFSGPQGSSLTWSDTVSFNLLEHGFFATLVHKPIADSMTTSGVAFALSLDSREAVDAITEAALAAGGTEVHGPEDEGFMYSRAFSDLDGHGFGPFWMNPEATAHEAEATAA